MRIVSQGNGVEEKLRLFIAITFVDIARKPIVSARDQLRSGFDRMLAQMFLQKLARDPATPQLLCLGHIFWPGAFLAPEIDRSVGFEIDRLFERFLDLSDTLIDSLLIKIVDLVSGFEVAQ